MKANMKNLSEQQKNLVTKLVENELPMTASEIVTNFGFTESYVSSVLSVLADRGILIRVGRTPPINGRAGHILWTVTTEVSKQFNIEETFDISQIAIDKSTKKATYREKIIEYLSDSSYPRTTGAITSKVAYAAVEREIYAILTILANEGIVSKVGYNDSKDSTYWLLTSTLEQYRNESIVSKIVDQAEEVAVKPSSYAMIYAIVKNYGKPISASKISKITGKSINLVATSLQAHWRSNKLAKTQSIGAFGNKIYWSLPENAPVNIRSL